MQYYYYDPNAKAIPPRALYHIGGDLFFFAAMVILHPIYYAFYWITDYYPMTTNGTLDFLADPKHYIFNLTLRNLLLIQVAYHALMVLFCGWLVYLFFKRKALFPKMFIAVHLVYFLLDAYYGYRVAAFLPYAHFWGPEQIRGTVLQMAVILGGGWYLLWSDRSKRTFWE